MFCKWTLLLFWGVLLSNSKGSLSWTETDIWIYVRKNLDQFKTQIKQKLNETGVNESLLKKRQSSEPGLYLGNCVESLEGHLSNTQQNINTIFSKLENIWMSTNAVKISSLKVNGSVFSQYWSKILKFQLDFKSSVSSPSFLNRIVKKMRNRVKRMQVDFQKTLSKSRRQFIKTRIILKNVTVGICKILELNNPVVLNGLPINRLTGVLRKNGNQKFQNKMVATNLSCRNSTVYFLNGNKVTDFIQLNPGNFVANGSYMFRNLFTREVFVNGAVNWLKVDSFVLTSGMQDIYDLKEFKKVSANDIRTNLVDEIHVGNLEKIKADLTTFSSELFFSLTLIIGGDLNISSINGKDIKQLFSKTVKTAEKQDISGKKNFKSTVTFGNVALYKNINNFTLHQFMTTNTNQSISAAIDFSNTATFQNIFTDSLNGIDLSQEAVIRSRKNVIRGRKTLTENCRVSSISLKEGKLIDSFDPSIEIFQIAKSDDVDTWDTFLLGSILVRNINATAVEVDAENFSQFQNLDNVWLRTAEQHISCIEAKNVYLNEVKVSRVNNLTIQALVKSKGNATIHSPFHFTEEVFVKTLRLGENSNINFSPEYWNQGKVKVSKNITMVNAVLKENLIVNETLKKTESDFMWVKDRQAIHGFVQFERIKVKNLNFENLNFSVINNINIKNFLDRAAVLPIGNKSIHNKYFKALNGPALICNGDLNNVSIGNVVLKNSIQRISFPWIFMKAPSFKKINAKNFLDRSLFESITYTDEFGVISNKQFNGIIDATHLCARGRINGVNLSDLHDKTFNKSKENSLKKKLIFYKNVEANKIQAEKNVDNVNLEHVIHTNVLTDLRYLNLFNITVQNITVVGPINGGDFQSVLNNSYEIGGFKNISARTFAKSMIIEGNLIINYLMRENFSDWISFLKLTSSEKIDRNLDFDILNVEKANFSKALNTITIDFLLEDSVKKYEDQNIFSKKVFSELIAEKLLFKKIDSYKIDGINTSEMFGSFINKTENFTYVLMNPRMQNLVAKQVSIIGKLNSLQLPDDVVLSNVNEIIISEVIINNTTDALTGLRIQGKVNGIDLKSFIAQRVTKNTSQEIFSVIEFDENIVLEGSTRLNGGINDMQLENILKTLPNQFVDGNKHFNSTLTILGHSAVNGHTNKAFVQQFLWRSRNEAVKETLFAMLNAPRLICDTINGIGMPSLYNYTHAVVHDMYDKLDALTSDILLLQDSFRIQKNSFEIGSFSSFKYFELREIIKIGPVLKFLPIYEYGTVGEKYELQVAQMVMWINKNVNGCKKIMSVFCDVSMNGTLKVTREMRGKIFPFSLQIEKEDDLIGFYVQAEYARKCNPRIKNLIIYAIFSSNSTNTSKITVPRNASLVDVQLLELDDIFLIVSFNMKDPVDRILIYHYDVSNNSWSEHQRFHTFSLSSFEFIVVERSEISLYDTPDVYLSVTGDKESPSVTVYEWDFESEQFYIKTNMSTTASTSAVWLHAHHNLYFLLAKEKTEVTRNHTKVAAFNEPLEVYMLDEDELILNHIVNVKGIRFIESFVLEGEIFLLAVSSHMGVVYVLQFRGYNGFEIIQEIPAAGVTEARAFTIDKHLYLALNSMNIQSRILKASIHGGRILES